MTMQENYMTRVLKNGYAAVKVCVNQNTRWHLCPPEQKSNTLTLLYN